MDARDVPEQLPASGWPDAAWKADGLIRPWQIAGGMVMVLACGLALESSVTARALPAPVEAEFARSVRPLLRRYCLGCHSTAKRAGELDLERFRTAADLSRGAKAWSHVPEMLNGGEMPPKGALQPSAQERRALSGWARRFLDAEALAQAGDPGPVVLRRLNNAEYTYTIRDLTGVDLDPVREFPADSAAGEGFTNTGNTLVMSPALLTKYFDAAKDVAAHAELLPDGFRFSRSTTRSDWTNEGLERIRALYRRYSDSAGASTVNLQGIVFNTNDGGRLPAEKYFAATLADRTALQAGQTAAVAAKRGLSPKYLGLLWSMLNDATPSPLLDSVRAAWRQARPEDTRALMSLVSTWQQALWRFTTVGQIGRQGSTQAWQEPVSPLAARQEVRLKLPASPDGSPVRVYLSTRDAGDGNAGDVALWERPRLAAPGRPELLLRDVRDFTREMIARRERLFATTASVLEAADIAAREPGTADLARLAREHGVDADSLSTWMEYLGIGSSAPIRLTHFGTKLSGLSGYAFVNGWGSPDLPSVITNSSNQHVRVPGNMKPHGVCVHPTPTLAACAGWRSPISGAIRIEGRVTHAHPECGNGVTWSLELRHGGNRRRLASGVAQGATAVAISPVAGQVRQGDLLSLVIGPRNGDHSCDLTDLELVIRSTEAAPREWSLTRDVADDILAGNPHADRLGNPDVWHFYSEPVSGGEAGPVIPPGSVLARWQAAESPAARRELGSAVQRLLTTGPPADANSADAQLYRQIRPLGGPLLVGAWRQVAASLRPGPGDGSGLDPALFGKHPSGGPVDPAGLCVQAPSLLEVLVPAELAAGAELLSAVSVQSSGAGTGSVQAQALLTRPGGGGLLPDAPVLTAEGSPARQRFEQAYKEFRALFPAALCYTKIVPVDEVVTLTLFYREDEALRRLMLTDAESARLDRLWTELLFVSQAPLKLINAYEQIVEFATQDRPDLAEPFRRMKKSIYDGAATFEREQAAAEPRHLDQLVQFAARAYRRPLAAAEAGELRGLYRKLRGEGLGHEEAFRLTLARVFVAPAFLYRLEAAPKGHAAGPVTDWELANRLSYFLWSSQPDDALRVAAASGSLRRPGVMAAQMRRMLADPKSRRLATEFACQWLHIYEFDALDEKSERHFPEFAGLRGDMYEEAIRFFTDIFQNDGSILSAFDADHTFVNERLAKFYGIPGITGEEWRRVGGMRSRGRGGILGLSATLARQSGASRTSPILRGNWVSEVLLGERLPRPPKDVPRLPEDETATDGLTVRQLVAKHTTDPRCSGCHRRIDPFGFSLEGFDAIGRARTKDLANRPVDTRTQTPDGKPIDGLAGLRTYLVQARRDAILRQFCRKLLGYSLGRQVQLSDEPLLTEIRLRLARSGYRFSVAVEAIVQSRQFREIRGAENDPR